jgi:hypothetical protein
MKKTQIILVGKAVALLLVVVAICDLTVDGWEWGVGSYIFAALLWSVFGLAILYAYTNIRSGLGRVVAIAFILLFLAAIWTELAVGAVSQLLGWLLS